MNSLGSQNSIYEAQVTTTDGGSRLDRFLTRALSELSRSRIKMLISESKQKPSIKEIIRLIVFSYEEFFFNLSSYNYSDFKKKADLMALN